MKVLVTGASGFIGSYVVKALVARGDEVVGLDSLNDYYDVRLKYARLSEAGIAQSEISYGRAVQSSVFAGYRFVLLKLEDRDSLASLFSSAKFDAVCHLAAQAGVRYSIDNPFAYVDSNLSGFVSVLECCRHHAVDHLVYASSSSVYGDNSKVPFSEEDIVDAPESLYAATKKANELMASCYTKLYGMAATGLRFFTVYGPWGRPDMAPMLFASAIAAGQPIKVFNHGDLLRDFTYIDDIVEGVVRVLDKKPEISADGRRHIVYNIGCSHPVRLMDFIAAIEKCMGHEAEKIMLPMQPGDVYQTYADTSRLERDFGYKPSTTLSVGISRFIEWFKNYYK